MIRDTQTFSRAFGGEVITTFSIDLGLSRLRFKHPIFRLLVKRSNPLRHCCDLIVWDGFFFVCLFWGFRPTREFFTQIEISLLPVKGYKCPMFGIHCLWVVRISWACHTYCDTEHPLIIVISEDTWHSDQLPSVLAWSCNYLFLRLRVVAVGIRTPNLPLARRTL